jgi:hypothetical protein
MMKTLMLLPILAFTLSACSTISRGGTDYLRIDTIPQGAKVTTTIETYRSRQNSKKYMNSKKEYRSCEPTPCLLEVGRRQTFAIRIEHEGYEPARIAIHGDIPMQTVNLDMAVPAGSVAANVVLGAASGAFVGTIGVVFTQAWFQVFTLSTVQAPTSGIVAGATAAGAGVGVAMVGIDLMSGSFENIYPNPVIVKLAPKGTPTITDPNMLMFDLRQAKKRVAHILCSRTYGTSVRQQRKKCEKAKELDKKRDLENAELLANEQAIKDLIKDIKRQLKEERTKARKAKRTSN